MNFKSLFKKYGIITIVVIIAITVLGGLTYAYRYNLPMVSTITNKNDCKKAVLNDLKAPSTAVWGNLEKSNVNLSTVIAIKGTVDSQNGFGGMGRSDFICIKGKKLEENYIVLFDGDTDKEETLYYKQTNSIYFK